MGRVQMFGIVVYSEPGEVGANQGNYLKVTVMRVRSRRPPIVELDLAIVLVRAETAKMSFPRPLRS